MTLLAPNRISLGPSTGPSLDWEYLPYARGCFGASRPARSRTGRVSIQFRIQLRHGMVTVPNRPALPSSSKQRRNVDYPGRKTRNPRNHRRRRDYQCRRFLRNRRYSARPVLRRQTRRMKRIYKMRHFLIN